MIEWNYRETAKMLIYINTTTLMSDTILKQRNLNNQEPKQFKCYLKICNT